MHALSQIWVDLSPLTPTEPLFFVRQVLYSVALVALAWIYSGILHRTGVTARIEHWLKQDHANGCARRARMLHIFKKACFFILLLIAAVVTHWIVVAFLCAPLVRRKHVVFFAVLTIAAWLAPTSATLRQSAQLIQPDFEFLNYAAAALCILTLLIFGALLALSQLRARPAAPQQLQLNTAPDTPPEPPLTTATTASAALLFAIPFLLASAGFLISHNVQNGALDSALTNSELHTRAISSPLWRDLSLLTSPIGALAASITIALAVHPQLVRGALTPLNPRRQLKLRLHKPGFRQQLLSTDSAIALTIQVFAASSFGALLLAVSAPSKIADVGASIQLSLLVSAYLLAVALKLTLGSTTLSIVTTTMLLQSAIVEAPISDMEMALILLAISCGAIFASHLNDPLFWVVKHLLRTNLRATLLRWTLPTAALSLIGFAVIIGASTAIAPDNTFRANSAPNTSLPEATTNATLASAKASTASTTLENDQSELPRVYPHPQQLQVHKEPFAFAAQISAVGAPDLVALVNNFTDLPLPRNTSATTNSTPIHLGLVGDAGTVDATLTSHKLTELCGVNREEHFTHSNAYVLNLQADAVQLLANSTDAIHYGLSSLRQLIQQANTSNMRELCIADYPDVPTRGFIEGYYGNPWSVSNRVELIRWAGNYKLNTYIYAPKDDAKHNERWRELYSEDELEATFAPLSAQAQRSRVRLVYALHPFMHQPLRFDQNYESDLALLKSKFLQVLDAGATQIAVLADDAADVGSSNYIRLLTDLEDWIATLRKHTNPETGTPRYPSLQAQIIFCPPAYMGFGESWYAQLPSSVAVINTGGNVWGKVDGAFTQRFADNSGGRRPYMWINWPTTDTARNLIHFGNYERFFGTDVAAQDVEAVVINPMQQSEPSKLGLFMAADYTWNLWRTENDGERSWHDAWPYVLADSAALSAESSAMRTVAWQMRFAKVLDKTWVAGESGAWARKIQEFDAAVRSGKLNHTHIKQMREFYTSLDTAIEVAQGAMTPEMRTQLEPWLLSLSDLSSSAQHYLAAFTARLDGHSELTAKEVQAGNIKNEAARLHGFKYLDTTEFAQAGQAYLIPSVSLMRAELNSGASSYTLEIVAVLLLTTLALRMLRLRMGHK